MDGPRTVRSRLLRALLLVLVATGSSGVVGVAVVEAQPRAQVDVAQAACTAPAWSPSASYNEGAVVSHRGHRWRANHWMWPGVEPGLSGAPPYWVPWTDLGTCGTGTTTTTAPPGSTTTTAPGSTTSTTIPSAGDVEDHFMPRGSWPVTTGTVVVPGATTGPVRLYYPTNLGANGTRHPILTYAAGTGYTFTADDDLANQLASWGFVVAGISSPGGGAEAAEADSMRSTADYLVLQNSNSASTFFGRLVTNEVGVLGHSQGALATLMTVGSSRNADHLFSSAAPLALPDRTWWAAGSSVTYSLVTNPTMFFAGGSDFLTISDQAFYFSSVPGPAAKAVAVGKDHNGMISASRAYVVAWFKYTLEGDSFARRAFVATTGDPPQMSSNPAWTGWASKNLS